jgi:hypothetical protein
MRRVTVLHFALTAAIPLASPACRSGRSHDASPSPQPRDAPHILSQAQLQAAIDVFVCAQWSAEANEWSLELFREDCSAREGAVPEPVRAAVRAAQPLIVLATHAYNDFYARTTARPVLSRVDADRTARAAFWADPVLARAIRLRVRLELATRGWRCTDCPDVASPDATHLGWDEFFPFLAAYVWPAQTEPGGAIELFVCADINGAATLPDAEPARLAGFLAAASFAADERRAHELRALRDAASSVVGMRQQLDAYLARPDSRRHACAAVAAATWFTGVIVEGCDAETDELALIQGGATLRSCSGTDKVLAMAEKRVLIGAGPP